MTQTANKQLRDLVTAFAHEPGGLLPLLHAVQDALGHIPADSLGVIAKAFNRSVAEVHGVISYYDRFTTEPAAKHVVQVCQAEACQAVGATKLHEKLRSLSAQSPNEELFQLQSVYCLGFCARGPAVVVNGAAHANIDAASIEQLLRDAGVVS